jgi:hypothetical protein
MDRHWTEFLRHSAPAEHAVQIYGELDELAASVAGFLAAGFAVDAPALVVARPEHWRRFVDDLAGCGWDAVRVVDEGLLEVADADAVLDSFTSGTGLDPARFEQEVGGLLDALASRFPGTTIRVFGEMVDILCERGRPAAAVALEQLWNDLARERRFALLCGYRLGALNGSELADVCSAHSRTWVSAGTSHTHA